MKKHISGSSLVEMILALAFCAVALAAVTSMLVRSNANSSVAKRQAQATALVNKGIEIAVNKKKSYSWSSLTSTHLPSSTGGSDIYCFNDSQNDIEKKSGTYCQIAGTVFTHKFEVSYLSGKLVVDGIVRWEEKGEILSAKQSIEMYEY